MVVSTRWCLSDYEYHTPGTFSSNIWGQLYGSRKLECSVQTTGWVNDETFTDMCHADMHTIQADDKRSNKRYTLHKQPQKRWSAFSVTNIPWHFIGGLLKSACWYWAQAHCFGGGGGGGGRLREHPSWKVDVTCLGCPITGGKYEESCIADTCVSR